MLGFAACQQDKTDPQALKPGERKAAPAENDPAVAGGAGEIAQVAADAPLPLDRILGAEPNQVVEFLGTYTGKGGSKKTCVRFIPNRTWFHCQQLWQTYEDKTGKFDSITVTFEDGKASAIVMEGFRREGTFDKDAALQHVGLQLPNPGRYKQPAPNVDLFTWFNDVARLTIAGRQYRVELSSVEQMWPRTKIEIVLNDVLDDDEAKRVFEVKPQNPQAAAPAG